MPLFPVVAQNHRTGSGCFGDRCCTVFDWESKFQHFGERSTTDHRTQSWASLGGRIAGAWCIRNYIYLFTRYAIYVNPFQLSEVDCELGTTWKKTEGYCARFQKNLKDHKAGPGWRQAHHKRLHQTILPITTWWPFWWSWWKYDLVSHTLSAVNLSFLNSSIHPPWFPTGDRQTTKCPNTSPCQWTPFMEHCEYFSQHCDVQMETWYSWILNICAGSPCS